MKAAPLTAVEPFELTRLIFSTEIAPTATVEGVNDLVAAGANGTLKLALAAEALLPALVTSAPAASVFVNVPPVLATTFAMTVQPPAGMLLPLASVIFVSPGVAVTPTQLPLLLAGLATVMPAGRLSIKAALKVIALALLLPSVSVSAFGVPGAMGPALAKLLASVGTFKATALKVALAVLPVPPLVELIALLVLT